MSGGGPSPAQICENLRHERASKEGYNGFIDRCRRNQREGKKQQLCGACNRWCWPEDRCGSFYRAESGEIDGR